MLCQKNRARLRMLVCCAPVLLALASWTARGAASGGADAPAADVTAPAAPAKKIPFGIEPVKRLRPAQLAPVRHDPEYQVQFQMAAITLKGSPPHYLRDLHLTLHVGSPAERPEVERAQGELQNFLTERLAQKTYHDMNRLAEQLRLRETMLLYLNERLERAVVREVFITFYNLR